MNALFQSVVYQNLNVHRSSRGVFGVALPTLSVLLCCFCCWIQADIYANAHPSELNEPKGNTPTAQHAKTQTTEVEKTTGSPVGGNTTVGKNAQSKKDVEGWEQLSYESAMLYVLQHHPELQVGQLSVQKSRAKRLSKQGAFDPYLKGKSFWQRFNSSSAVGKSQNSQDYSLSLNLPTRLGAKLIAGGKLAAGDIKTPVSPTGDGGEYFWGIELPLLRGFLMNDKIAAEKQAKIQEVMAPIKFQEKTLKILLKANKAYWKWNQARENVQVAVTLKDLADIRLKQVQEKVRAGDKPAIDIAEATREVAKRNGQYAQAKRQQQQASYALGLYLWKSPTGMGEKVFVDQAPLLSLDHSAQAVGSTQKKPVSSDLRDIEKDVETALRNRPELKRLGLTREVVLVDKSLASNQLLPQLDVIATQGIETGEQSIGPVFRAGIQLKVPLRYRTPLGERRQAQYTLDQLSIQQSEQKQKIIVDVYDTLSAWEAAYAQYHAAQQESDAAEKLADGERTRFSYGDTTLFFVNRRERAAADAVLKRIAYENKVFELMHAYQYVLGTL